MLHWLPFGKLLFLLKLQQKVDAAIRRRYSGRSQHLMLIYLFKVLVLPDSIQYLLVRSTDGLLLLNELDVLLIRYRMDYLVSSRLRNKRRSTQLIAIALRPSHKAFQAITKSLKVFNHIVVIASFFDWSEFITLAKNGELS